MTTPQLTPQILDPVTFPLHGMRLIEASAGTGKTFTIAALYLRLLLGHGAEGSRHPRPLDVDQILVVTFTEAATEELRDRIRRRIQEARQAFVRGETTDPYLRLLLDSIEDKAWAARTLGAAARSMDQAAIFTIHGFCQRMLRQHAFESGSLFETELTQDEGPLRREAMLDYWRSHIYDLPPALAEAVLQQWPEPGRLLAEIDMLLATEALRLEPDLGARTLADEWQRQLQQVEAFKRAWRECDEDLLALLMSGGLNGNSYRKTSVPGWLAAIDRYVASEQVLPDKELAGILEKFGQQRLREKTRKGGVTPVHPLFEQLDQLCESWMPLRELVLGEALREVRQRLARHKQQLRLLGFDDLLSGLGRALDSAVGSRLAGAIREQFPVALIDEFQDTDPLQYRIFSRLYAGEAGCGLFMIGDPKQAIYAFRGADIFTYIQARRAVSDHYTLGTNWRSSSAMIAAVNRLFERNEAPFIYDRDIPFYPVKAAGKADRKPLKLDGETVPAMTLWHNPGEPVAKQDYLRLFADACASQVVRLLNGDARIGEQPLEAHDLAVLVRDRFEATAVQQALRRRLVASVYKSGRDSVFATREALDLYRVLQAVQEPQQERQLRAALATAVLLQDVHALQRLNDDEAQWESLVAEFIGYHECWSRFGVLACVHRLLEHRDLAAGLLARPDGERRLTDLLHLAELLQEMSQEVEGMPGLMRRFREHLLDPSGGGDAQQLRLESDRNRVTIITIHKSKGLEYPVVLLPFPVNHRTADRPLYHDDESTQPVFDLADGDEAKQKADRERLAEDLRLLYVALTRSVHACYLGISDLRKGSGNKSVLAQSALGYLLLAGQQSERLPEILETLAQENGVLLCPPPQDDAVLRQGDAAAPALRVRSFPGPLPRDWRIASYTQLSSHGSSRDLPELPGLDLEVAAEAALPAETDERTIFGFPKGARAGTFLHGLFEQLDFPSARGEALQALICQRLQLEGFDEHWCPVLETLVSDVLEAPLNDEGLRLRSIASGDRLIELEFMLPANGLEAAALNGLLRRGDPLAADAGALQFERVQGMLKGFIDLVFRVDGRYYILDYKSNHLGQDIGDYGQDALRAAMQAHRYDLQYQLYTLALHRLLRQRLPDYDYERHFGGVFYLFLRGMRAGDAERHGVFHCRPAQALVEALDRLFAGTGEEAA